MGAEGAGGDFGRGRPRPCLRRRRHRFPPGRQPAQRPPAPAAAMCRMRIDTGLDRLAGARAAARRAVKRVNLLKIMPGRVQLQASMQARAGFHPPPQPSVHFRPLTRACAARAPAQFARRQLEDVLDERRGRGARTHDDGHTRGARVTSQAGSQQRRRKWEPSAAERGSQSLHVCLEACLVSL